MSRTGYFSVPHWHLVKDEGKINKQKGKSKQVFRSPARKLIKSCVVKGVYFWKDKWHINSLWIFFINPNIPKVTGRFKAIMTDMTFRRQLLQWTGTYEKSGNCNHQISEENGRQTPGENWFLLVVEQLLSTKPQNTLLVLSEAWTRGRIYRAWVTCSEAKSHLHCFLRTQE